MQKVCVELSCPFATRTTTAVEHQTKDGVWTDQVWTGDTGPLISTIQPSLAALGSAMKCLETVQRLGFKTVLIAIDIG